MRPHKRVPLGAPLDDDLDALCMPEAIQAQSDAAAAQWRQDVPPSIEMQNQKVDLRGVPDAEAED